MPVTIDEVIESRDQELTVENSFSAQRKYRVIGTADETVVHQLVQSTIPAMYLGMNFAGYKITPENVDEVTGWGMWSITVDYALIPPRKISFSTGGGTTRITKSHATVWRQSLNANETAPDFRGAIGVSADSVEGCDIITPNFQFTIEERRYFTEDGVLSFLVDAGNTTGKTNDSTFLGFEAGTLLLEDITGTPAQNSAYHDVAFKFGYSPNAQVQIPIYPGIWHIRITPTATSSLNTFMITIVKGVFTDNFEVSWTDSAATIQATMMASPLFGAGQSVTVADVTPSGDEIAAYSVVFSHSFFEFYVSQTFDIVGGAMQEGPMPTKVMNERAIVPKSGWDYLWIRFKDSVDAGQLVKTPASVYVEQVYKSANFSLLGITETWDGLFANQYEFLQWFQSTYGGAGGVFPGGAT